ncbi:hypothetical protein E4T56_gene12119 [Termitomyces sp. T112]|nr:hypothetical protein E4T56_gene12119 [Termitomyces sp. T112]
MDGSAANAWSSLTPLHDAKTNLGLIHAEEELGSLKYVNSSSIEAHFKVMQTAWAKANDQGAGIDDRWRRAYIIKLMPPSWAPVTGSLASEPTFADMVVRLTTHALLLHGTSAISLAKSAQALLTQTGSQTKSALVYSNPNCKRTRHTADKCFQKGGGMEGQYLDWWRKGHSSNTSGNVSLNRSNKSPLMALQAKSVVMLANNDSSPWCLALLTLASIILGNKITYADSAMSHHFFTNQEDFITYKDPDAACRTGKTAKGTFGIAGCATIRPGTNGDEVMGKLGGMKSVTEGDLNYFHIKLDPLLHVAIHVVSHVRDDVPC